MALKHLSYKIDPVGKPRMTQRDKWAKRPAVMRYWAFTEAVKLKKLDLMNGDSILFMIPMPKSWSRKKRAEMAGKPHESKPDLSNLLKALEDAAASWMGIDDCVFHNYSGLKKIWWTEGWIIIYREVDDGK